jgi:hypothetical protein
MSFALINTAAQETQSDSYRNLVLWAVTLGASSAAGLALGMLARYATDGSWMETAQRIFDAEVAARKADWSADFVANWNKQCPDVKTGTQQTCEWKDLWISIDASSALSGCRADLNRASATDESGGVRRATYELVFSLKDKALASGCRCIAQVMVKGSANRINVTGEIMDIRVSERSPSPDFSSASVREKFDVRPVTFEKRSDGWQCRMDVAPGHSGMGASTTIRLSLLIVESVWTRPKDPPAVACSLEPLGRFNRKEWFKAERHDVAVELNPASAIDKCSGVSLVSWDFLVNTVAVFTFRFVLRDDGFRKGCVASFDVRVPFFDGNILTPRDNTRAYITRVAFPKNKGVTRQDNVTERVYGTRFVSTFTRERWTYIELEFRGVSSESVRELEVDLRFVG